MSILRDFSELNDLEKLSVMPMSYSRLETFDKCQEKYFHAYIEKVPQGFSAPAAAGSAVHEVLEHTDLNNMDRGDMRTRLDEAYKSHDPDGLIPDDTKVDMEVCLDDFYADNSFESFDVIGNEFAFEVVIGNYLFRGYIDRVDRNGDTILVTDYKTGKFQVSARNAGDNFQLGLYAAVCRKMFPWAKGVRAELYYLRSQKKIGHTYSDQELDEMELKILHASNMVKYRNNFLPTQMEWVCKRLCDYGKSGHCARGKTVLGNW